MGCEAIPRTYPVFLRIKYGDAMKIKVVYKGHEFFIDEENSDCTNLKYSFKDVEHLIQSIVSAVDGIGRADSTGSEGDDKK